MKERWSGDLNQIYVLRPEEMLLIRMRTAKEQLAFNGRFAQLSIELVEVVSPGIELVLKQVTERDDLRLRISRKRCGYGRTAIPATKQPQTNGRVRLISECRVSLHQKNSRHSLCSSLEKLSTVHFVKHPLRRERFCFGEASCFGRAYPRTSLSRLFPGRFFSWRTSSICCGPEVSRSMVTAPL